MESPSSPSQASPNFSGNGGQQRHFYLAVDRPQFKMEMLVDLLGMAGRHSRLPMVVCCSSRDVLDAVCSSVSSLPSISLSSLHSDQAESERTLVLETFRQATVKWNECTTILQSGDDDDDKSQLIVATEFCLPGVYGGESPLASGVLINYELPSTKEAYTRRMSKCIAPGGIRILGVYGIVINVVAGKEVATLKNIEKSWGFQIDAMPINISEILGAPA
ncbi:ATP-dependent RNA helicase FAL1 [Linum perenne]